MLRAGSYGFSNQIWLRAGWVEGGVNMDFEGSQAFPALTLPLNGASDSLSRLTLPSERPSRRLLTIMPIREPNFKLKDKSPWLGRFLRHKRRFPEDKHLFCEATGFKKGDLVY